VAYPAECRSYGVTTFIVTEDGVVYQKDLGRKTDVLAKVMKEYDCNPSWQKAEEQLGGGCCRAESQVTGPCQLHPFRADDGKHASHRS